TATPVAGWSFAGWSGDATGLTNPLSVTVDRDLLITGLFDVDVTPPAISNIQVSSGSTGATISWTTDDPTTGVVSYGETTGYELGTVSSPTMQTSHSVVL